MAEDEAVDQGRDDTRTDELLAERGPRGLRRSRRDRVVAGVCGGVGEYLGVDPVLLRLAAVALTLSGGAGVLTYVMDAVVVWPLVAVVLTALYLGTRR